MSDKAFLMEAINDYLEGYMEKRLSELENKGSDFTDSQLREMFGKYIAAKAIKADLNQRFAY